MITGTREADLLAAADLLMDARRTLTPIPGLPPDLAPVNVEEALFIQSLLIQAYGPIGGYKVGASAPDATPTFSAIPLRWIGDNNTTITTGSLRGVEAEVAFLLAHDLPPATYTQDQVLDAIDSCHPVLEILESAFTPGLPKTDTLTLSKLADLQSTGGLVTGPAFPAWRTFDFTHEPVTLAIDGSIRVERTGSNPAGDLFRLLTWLANQGQLTGGLRASQWITTGSWTGATYATQHSSASGHFTTLGRVNLHFS